MLERPFRLKSRKQVIRGYGGCRGYPAKRLFIAIELAIT